VEVFRTAVALMVRSMVLGARSAGRQRLLFLQQAVAAGETAGELARLRDENRRLTSENRLLKARFGTDDEQTPILYGTPLTDSGGSRSRGCRSRLHARVTTARGATGLSPQ